MMCAVKICGLTRPEDIECAVRYGADFLGFIVECPSKRRLSVAQAARLSVPAKGLASRVAVTVNPDDDLIDRILTQMQPDYIQLHGDETPARAAEIARRCKVIKAVGIASDEDMKTAETYAGVADFILYDAKPPKDDAARGGHGITIDWNIIAHAPTPKTFAVAGGLTPDNVARAIAATRAPIVDVSSGVEASAGVKDHSKITAFMDAVYDFGVCGICGDVLNNRMALKYDCGGDCWECVSACEADGMGIELNEYRRSHNEIWSNHAKED